MKDKERTPSSKLGVNTDRKKQRKNYAYHHAKIV